MSITLVIILLISLVILSIGCAAVSFVQCKRSWKSANYWAIAGAIFSVVIFITLCFVITKVYNAVAAVNSAVTTNGDLNDFDSIDQGECLESAWISDIDTETLTSLTQATADLRRLKENKNISTDKYPDFGYIEDIDGVLNIVLRGSQTKQDFKDDFDYIQTDEGICDGCSVHRGFKRVADALWTQAQSALQSSPNTVRLTGISLGAAVATILGGRIAVKYPEKDVEVIALASPRVGNSNYAKFLSSLSNFKLDNVMNLEDIVPDLPFSFTPNFSNPKKPFQFEHAGRILSFQSSCNSLIKNHTTAYFRIIEDS